MNTQAPVGPGLPVGLRLRHDQQLHAQRHHRRQLLHLVGGQQHLVRSPVHADVPPPAAQALRHATPPSTPDSRDRQAGAARAARQQRDPHRVGRQRPGRRPRQRAAHRGPGLRPGRQHDVRRAATSSTSRRTSPAPARWPRPTSPASTSPPVSSCPTSSPIFNAQVKAVEALPDGRLAVGGEFTHRQRRAPSPAWPSSTRPPVRSPGRRSASSVATAPPARPSCAASTSATATSTWPAPSPTWSGHHRRLGLERRRAST